MTQDLEARLSTLMSTFFHDSCKSNQNPNTGDSISDIFIVSILCELDEDTAMRIAGNMEKLITMAMQNPNCVGLSSNHRYCHDRLRAALEMAQALRTMNKLQRE